ncbi:hypothetical protein [Alcaligenes sp. Marseille-Q7550]
MRIIMSDNATTLNPPHTILALLQHLQLAQPHAQIAVLHFTDDEAAIGLARKGVPVHIEPFPELTLTQLLATCFAGPGTTALQLEQAIEVVEDALMPARLDLRQFQVFASGSQAGRLMQWIKDVTGNDNHALSIENLETVFNIYADATVGASSTAKAAESASGPSPLDDKSLGAYLLLLRECLHHLHVSQIQLLCD